MKNSRAFFKMAEVRAAKDESGKMVVSGYAAVFNSLSVPLWGFREKIAKGAFTKTIADPTNNIRALWNHNSDIVLGSTGNGSLKLTEDERGLRFELDVAPTTAGNDAFISIQRGDVDGVSFRFNALKQSWDETDPANVVRTLEEIECNEISPTPFPAYEATTVNTRTAKDDYKDLKEQRDAELAQKAAADAVIANSNELYLRNKKLNLST
jgi:HK97 family phage prohead protease